MCRPIAAAESRQRRGAKEPEGRGRGEDGDGMEDDVRAAAMKRGRLKAACVNLTEQAERLEEALGEREHATTQAKSVLRDFKDALQVVGRTAQILVAGET